MVDTLVSGASASRRVGSTPISGTLESSVFMAELFSMLLILYFYDSNNFESYENCISGCGDNGRCLI